MYRYTLDPNHQFIKDQESQVCMKKYKEEYYGFHFGEKSE